MYVSTSKDQTPMAHQWRALPIPGATGISLKAPSLQMFERQAALVDQVPLSLEEAHEVLTARELVEAILEGDPPKQGARYEIWRYNVGIACKCPSGWTLYVPMETKSQ